MTRLCGPPRLTQPFLKWAGGKRGLLGEILAHIDPPSPGRRYFEPFLGGGAVFFALTPREAILSDANEQLIETYWAVREEVESVIDRLRRFRYSEESYYRVRASRPRSPAGRAARFIFLNKTCFNGLYRENLNGEFNVPFGRQTKPPETCDVGQLRRASEALQVAAIRAHDFEDVVLAAGRDDVVYFDPPYVVSHTNNGFVEYNARIFAWNDQQRLAELALTLVRRGVNVFVSNADHVSIRRLYRNFEVHKIVRSSTMAASASKRFTTAELLLVGRP